MLSTLRISATQHVSRRYGFVTIWTGDKYSYVTHDSKVLWIARGSTSKKRSTGQILAEVARVLKLGVYRPYTLNITEEYIFAFVKMEGPREEMRAAHSKKTPTFPERL